MKITKAQLVRMLAFMLPVMLLFLYSYQPVMGATIEDQHDNMYYLEYEDMSGAYDYDLDYDLTDNDEYLDDENNDYDIDLPGDGDEDTPGDYPEECEYPYKDNEDEYVEEDLEEELEEVLELFVQPLSGLITTEADLVNAINAAAANTPVTITINDTINIANEINVGNARNITINGTGTLTVSSNTRHFRITGLDTTLTLAGSITLTRAEGYTGNGGGVRVYGTCNSNPRNANLTLRENAAIINNRASGNGGGVFLSSGTVNLHDNSRIEHNHAFNGGGVSATHDNRCGVNMWGNSSISYNTANIGGGIVFGTLDDLAMHGGRINGNTANGRGGGISAGGGTTHLEMFAGEIRNNTAGGNGGAIYATSHGSLAIHEAMVFGGNTANSVRTIDLEMGLLVWPFIRWSGYNSVVGSHLINNYDISYAPIAFVQVTFYGNGGIILAENLTRNVTPGGGLGPNMPPNPIHPDGAAFLGWTFYQDGTGGAFTSTTQVNSNITVYAQWDTTNVEPPTPPTPPRQPYPPHELHPPVTITTPPAIIPEVRPTPAPRGGTGRPRAGALARTTPTDTAREATVPTPELTEVEVAYYDEPVVLEEPEIPVVPLIPVVPAAPELPAPAVQETIETAAPLAPVALKINPPTGRTYLHISDFYGAFRALGVISIGLIVFLGFKNKEKLKPIFKRD